VLVPGSTEEFTDYVMDMLAPIAGLRKARFFGGTGISAGTVQFAMIIEDALYFVVDDVTRPKYEEMGTSCFTYNTRKGRVDVRRYYEVPAEMLDDQEQLLELAEESITAAAGSVKPKRKKGPRERISLKKEH
jgi:DNA transformation protein and related proteins